MVMTKARAFELLGTARPAEVARLVRITPQAVNAWPDELTAAIEDRVVAAIARRHLPPELIGAGGALAVPAEEARDAA